MRQAAGLGARDSSNRGVDSGAARRGIVLRDGGVSDSSVIDECTV